MKLIGKIVGASGHTDYLCQVYGTGEVECPPAASEYGFGAFVGIEIADGGHIVGIIHNTTLYNPEFGNLGPRLSLQGELAVFSPDYLAEKATIVAIAAIGTIDAKGCVYQGVPQLAATIDARVGGLEPQQVRAFHLPAGELRVSYFPMLIRLGTPLVPHLLLGAIDRLQELVPSETPRLAVLASNLAWKARVESLR